MPMKRHFKCFASGQVGRKFNEALKVLPSGQYKIETVTQQCLQFCYRIFTIERELKNKASKDRNTVHQEQSRSVLDAYLAWLRQQRSRTLPKSKLGEAIGYSLNQPMGQIDCVLRGRTARDR